MLTGKYSKSLLHAEQLARGGRNDGKKPETEAGSWADPIRAQRMEQEHKTTAAALLVQEYTYLLAAVAL